MNRSNPPAVCIIPHGYEKGDAVPLVPLSYTEAVHYMVMEYLKVTDDSSPSNLMGRLVDRLHYEALLKMRDVEGPDETS